MAEKIPNSIAYYNSLPKIDLHRHLEGSLRLSTLVEIGREHGIDFAHANQLRDLVQIGNTEEFTFENFLSKFQTLRLFFHSHEVIERLTIEAIEDAAIDNVRYLELRFTPVALSRIKNFDLGAVMDWVIHGAEIAEAMFGVKTRLIASVNRHEGVDIAWQVAKLAFARQDRGIVGMDLAGNEAHFDGMDFRDIFQTARQEGLYTTIHAGEWGPPRNVSNAITQLGADRIGHGVRVMEDPEAIQIARERGIPFEVCITSNYQSGVTDSLMVHPILDMIEHGLNVTIATDDPSISQIRLSDEYKLIREEFGLSQLQLHERVLAAAKASFLPPNEQKDLIEQIIAEFSDL